MKVAGGQLHRVSGAVWRKPHRGGCGRGYAPAGGGGVTANF